MRHSSLSQTILAGLLILAVPVSVTGLLGATSPTVKIKSPSAGAKVSGTVAVTVSIKGSDSVSYAILVVDEDRPSSTNTAPYSFELDTALLSDGPHRIFVEVYDHYGLIASSKAITIHVRNGSSSPARPAPVPPAPGRVARTVGPEPSRTVLAGAPSSGEPSTRPSFASAAVPEERPAAAAPRARSHAVVLNGRLVDFTVEPYVVRGRMQVAFRSMFEQIGARVSWNPGSRTAHSVTPTTAVAVPAGSTAAMVNGRSVEMGGTAVIRQARMVIPLRFFAGVTDSSVGYNAESKVASLDSAPRAFAQGARGE